MVKPGQSGCPGGKPRGTLCLTAQLRRELRKVCKGDKEGRKNFEIFVQQEILRALKGDKEARKVLWERIDGLPDANINVNTQGEFVVKLTNRDGYCPPED